jgi:hypothetical protein
VFLSLWQLSIASIFAPRQTRSLLGGYQGHDALVPPRFFRNFSKKNSDNFVETNRTSEKVFKRKLELTKGKDDDLRGITSHCSFKVPSANASAAMARRLASTSLVSGFHPTSFQEPLSDRQDSSPEKCIHEQNPG